MHAIPPDFPFAAPLVPPPLAQSSSPDKETKIIETTQDLAFKALTSSQPVTLGYLLGSDYMDRVTSIDVRGDLVAFQCNNSFLHIFNRKSGDSASLEIQCRVNEVVRLMDTGIAIGGFGNMDFLRFTPGKSQPIEITPFHHIRGKFREKVVYSDPRDDYLMAVADHKVTVLEIYNGNVLQHRINDLADGSNRICRGLQLQDDHAVIAIANMENYFEFEHMIVTYSLSTGKKLKTMYLTHQPLKLAGDQSSQIAVADINGDITIFNTQQGSSRFNLKVDWGDAPVKTRRIIALQITQKWIVAISNNNHLQIWRAATGQACHSIPLNHKMEWNSLLAIDGNKVAFATKYTIEVWDCFTGVLLHSFYTGAEVTALRFKNRDEETYLIAGLTYGVVQIWSSKAAQPKEKFIEPWFFPKLDKALEDEGHKRNLAAVLEPASKRQRSEIPEKDLKNKKGQ